jgi:hypothetical protein
MTDVVEASSTCDVDSARDAVHAPRNPGHNGAPAATAKDAEPRDAAPADAADCAGDVVQAVVDYLMKEPTSHTDGTLREQLAREGIAPDRLKALCTVKRNPVLASKCLDMVLEIAQHAANGPCVQSGEEHVQYVALRTLYVLAGMQDASRVSCASWNTVQRLMTELASPENDAFKADVAKVQQAVHLLAGTP